MFLRLVKVVVKVEKDLENQRQILANHKSFSAAECFQVFDEKKEDAITPERMVEVFRTYNINLQNVDTLFDIFDTNKDGLLDLKEFSRQVSPKTQENRGYYGAHEFYCTQQATVEERSVWLQSWLETLASLFESITNGHLTIESKRDALNINGPRIF